MEGNECGRKGAPIATALLVLRSGWGQDPQTPKFEKLGVGQLGAFTHRVHGLYLTGQ